MRVVKRLVQIGTLSCQVLLIGGYLGALHPLGDSLAVFRPQLAAVLSAVAVFGVFTLRWPLPSAALAIAVVSGLTSWPFPRLPDPDAQSTSGLMVYQKNLSFRGDQPAAFLAELVDVSPDILTLQEVNSRNRAAIYDVLPPEYARHICPFATVGAVAVAARYEVVPDSEICLVGQGLVGFQVITPWGPIWVISIHLHWPWPYGQAAQAEALLAILDGFEGQVILGGDFNMVPWSYRMRAFERTTNGRVLGHAPRTLIRHGIGLLIDHVLAGSRGWVERRPLFGSDHYGVLARIALGS